MLGVANANAPYNPLPFSGGLPPAFGFGGRVIPHNAQNLQLTDADRGQQLLSSRMANDGELLMRGTTLPEHLIDQVIPSKTPLVKELMQDSVIMEYAQEAVDEAVTAFIELVLPPRVVSNQQFSVHKLEMNPAWMQAYAEFGVPETQSFKMTSHTYDMGRRGLGYRMEFNLAQTMQGAKLLSMFVENTAVAFVKSFAIQAMGALMRARGTEERTFPLLDERQVYEVLAARSRFNSIMTKRENGLALAVGRAVDIIRRRAVEDVKQSDLVLIIPEELVRALSSGNPGFFKLMNPDVQGVAAKQLISSLTGQLPLVVFPTSMENGIPVQPLVTQVNHGGYGVLPVNAMKRCAPREYTTELRNITMQAYTYPGSPKEVSLADVAKGAWTAFASGDVAARTLRFRDIGVTAITDVDAETEETAVAGANAIGIAEAKAVDPLDAVDTLVSTPATGARWMFRMFRVCSSNVGAWARALFDASVGNYARQVAIRTAAATALTAAQPAAGRQPLSFGQGCAVIIGAFHAMNVFDPFDYAVLRPDVCWSQAHAILMPGRGKAGFMAYQPPNVLSELDAATKDYRWHMHFYSGPVLTAPEKIVHMNSLLTVDYHHGGSLKVATNGTRDRDAPTGAPKAPDTYPILLHHKDDAELMGVDRQPFDITGQFGDERVPATAGGLYKYHTVFAEAYGWTHAAESVHGHVTRNTVVFPDSQYLTLPVTGQPGGNPTGLYLPGKGPWGGEPPSVNFTQAVLGSGSPKIDGTIVVASSGSALAPSS
jgi:hypothetical protein